jgi:hypothetical protein
MVKTISGSVNKVENFGGNINKENNLNGSENQITLTPAYKLEGETLILPEIEDKFLFTFEGDILYLNTELTN